jgi:hypothetical protein
LRATPEGQAGAGSGVRESAKSTELSDGITT